MKAPMPRLSETCRHPPGPDICQNCGISWEHTWLHFWQECDENDIRESILIALCATCSDKIIDPHPRLYHEWERGRPWPGGMKLCIDCRNRDGMSCTHPLPEINAPKPSVVFLDGTFGPRGGRRKGMIIRSWNENNTTCSGKETKVG